MKSSSDGQPIACPRTRRHRRVDVGQPLDEQPPRREEVIPLIAAFVEREQVRETWLDESPLIRVGEVFLNDGGGEHLASADRGSSSSVIRARILTMSAKAQ